MPLVAIVVIHSSLNHPVYEPSKGTTAHSLQASITCTPVTSGFWTPGSCLTCTNIVHQSSGQLRDEISKPRTGDKASETEQREVAQEVSILLLQALSPFPSPGSQNTGLHSQHRSRPSHWSHLGNSSSSYSSFHFSPLVFPSTFLFSIQEILHWHTTKSLLPVWSSLHR